MARYSFLLSGRWIKYIAMTIIVVIACVSLALWQKDRRQQRIDEIATIDANYNAKPVDLDQILPSTSATLTDAQEWVQVSLTGHFLEADTVLARNRTVNDQTGFYVVVPFELDSGSTIALVRGWISDPDSAPTAPTGEQTIVARLRPAQDGAKDDNPAGMIKAIDPARIPGMDDAYRHVYAEQSTVDGAGTTADAGLTPLPPPDRSEGNHLSYMLQWFVFGIMIIIAVSISARRERRAAAEAHDGPMGDIEYEVVDKAALVAGAKVSGGGSRYGRHSLKSPVINGEAEQDEDAMIEQRFR